jgi:uncharacterized OB-fold protein
MALASDTEAKELFWRSVDERSMQLPYCLSCNAFFFYPRPFCPVCWSDQVEFRPASGKGTIWTFTVVRFAHGIPSPWHDRLPFVVAIVTLSEGVRMMGNVIDCDVDQVRSGMPVQLAYAEVGGRTLPCFHLESR